MKKLELFYFEACPYCQIVLSKINKLNLKVELLNIRENQDYLKRLVSDTGRQTVPCLYIDNNPMHESAEIALWLEENMDNLQKNS